MTKTIPCIIFATSFVTAHGSKQYGGYIDYMDADEKTRNDYFKDWNILKPKDFGNYNHYMSNPKKSSGLFSSREGTFLNEAEKQALKKQFQVAQKNDSCMWQDIVSFHNPFLEKYGLYRSEDNSVMEDRLMSATRIAMKDILEKNGMAASAIWSASFHYDQDNIHIHIALVEPQPTRPYWINPKTGETTNNRVGYRGKASLRSFKSHFLNVMIDRSKELAKISNLVREELSGDDVKKIFAQKRLAKQWRDIYSDLPRVESGYRAWRYNMNLLSDVRPKIDCFIDAFLENENSSKFQELKDLIQAEDDFRREAYGDSEFKKFDQNLSDFSMGNQEKIKAVIPEATIVHQKDVWAKMGMEPKAAAQAIHILVPVENEEAMGQVHYRAAVAYDISQMQNPEKFRRENSHLRELRTRLGNFLLRDMIYYDRELSKARQHLSGYRFKRFDKKASHQAMQNFSRRIEKEIQKQHRKNQKDFEILNQIEDELKGFKF